MLPHAPDHESIFASVDEVVAFAASELDGEWIFRGHADDNWRLRSTLFRLSDATERRLRWQDTVRFVDWILANHRVRIVSDTDSDATAVATAIAIAQHHGFATPFLDFSLNVRVAAFFATAGVSASELGCIYGIPMADVDRRLASVSGLLRPPMDLPFIVRGPFPHVLRIQHQEGVFVQGLSEGPVRNLAASRFRFRHTGRAYEDGLICPNYIFPPATRLEAEIEHYKRLYSGFKEHDI